MSSLSPGGGGVFVELGEAVAIDRVEVGKQDDGRLGAFAELPDQVEDLVGRRSCFEGTVGGVIPTVRYADNRIDFDGGLSMTLFDGRVDVSSLAIERPFGV